MTGSTTPPVVAPKPVLAPAPAAPAAPLAPAAPARAVAAASVPSAAPSPAVSPQLIEKVTHYLHAGFSARAHGRLEVPPALGDARWTPELILATWYMAETGRVPESGLEYRVGRSGGGFDRLDFKLLPAAEQLPVAAAVDTSIPLNRRDEGGGAPATSIPATRTPATAPAITLPLPLYGGGMSYGSVSENVMIARAMAAASWGTFVSTGEGGYPPGLEPWKEHVITQVATGLFGVEERTIQYAPIVELKYAQGAKPGLGGHLLGEKSTTAVARMRGSVPWVSLFSPFPFHSVYSVEDHRKHVDWIKTINPRALIAVKVSTPVDVDMVAVGSYYAGAHILHLDGAYGGTGAAPEIAKKNIAMPIELAVPKVHKHLIREGIRDRLTLMASGGIRTPWDVAKIIALGADGAVLATTELVAMGCTRCSNCERGRGCTFGLTTTDPELQQWVQPEWGAARLANLFTAFHAELASVLRRLGIASVRALRGRTDLLRYLSQEESLALPAPGRCGVVGLACEVPIAGRHLVGALGQMRNRGNGKGGGVAMVGLDPAQLGVGSGVLRGDYLLGLAYLDASVRAEVEERHLAPVYHLDAVRELAPAVAEPADLGLEVRPPEAVLYFVRPREGAVARLRAELAAEGGAEAGAGPGAPPAAAAEGDERRALEDELVYQSAFRLNAELYAGRRGNLAYVQCHGKDLLVLKMVGYAEDVVRWYGLEQMTAHVWIGHHRYPTKGKVWHPGGAHPFVGGNEALVHNGDFANYQSICDYLAQRGIRPLFMTDTEVAALVYDLHRRVYRYPLEYVIETLAPTTERDFALLPPDKRQVYRALQTTHIHGSPDGPWFFIIAESLASEWRLLGVTDTSMLRPQVFALQRGAASIAFCASEKQVIDAVLASLAAADPRFWSRPDRTWVARGGSHTDGGAFVFTLRERPDGGRELLATDKFGVRVDCPTAGDATALPAAGDATAPLAASAIAGPQLSRVPLPSRQAPEDESAAPFPPILSIGTSGLNADAWGPDLDLDLDLDSLLLSSAAWPQVAAVLRRWSWEEAASFLRDLRLAAREPARRPAVLALATALLDRRYDTGRLRRSRWLSLLDDCFERMLADLERAPGSGFVTHAGPGSRPQAMPEQTLVIDARRYSSEGEGSAATELAALHRAGWRRFLVAHARGHRFLGCALGPGAAGVRIDVYGSPGDYLGSGADGLEIHVHGDGQDQLAQIFRDGVLVVHGDVGQAFGYGAKGGEAYILGSAAGRPMINAVGAPRVVINGTCLDYLAESFMAGDPQRGGGFVILNGVAFDDRGRLVDLDEPYPGGNLFSLASGGALYLRDPHGRLDDGQLNGGEFAPFTAADWELIRPYLETNAAHFDVPVDRLLTVAGRRCAPGDIYRKVCPVKHRALQAEEAWVGHRG